LNDSQLILNRFFFGSHLMLDALEDSSTFLLLALLMVNHPDVKQA
jgi:hypothetical protein